MAMITIRHEKPGDVATRESLLDAAFGLGRTGKTAERLREGRLPADGLSFVVTTHNGLIGTVRLWHVACGEARPALLLGPLAVAITHRGHGIGSDLMHHALQEARKLGHEAVLLVGDAPYYGRFGFSTEKTGKLWLPGPFERDRLLALELVPRALDGAHGIVSGIGCVVPAVQEARPLAA